MCPLVVSLYGVEGEVFPLKAGLHDLLNVQQLLNIPDNFLRCCCCQGNDDGMVQPAQLRNDGPVARAEIMAPLGYAMSVITGNEGQENIADNVQEAARFEPFRCHVYKYIFSLSRMLEPLLLFLPGKGTVDISGGDSEGKEAIHLVFH